MSAQFLHGVEVMEIDAGPRPIQTVKSSVIGVVGTAPDADNDVFPLNTPVMVAGSRAKAAKLDMTGNGKGTLGGAMDGIFDQSGAAVVVVRVAEDADTTTQLANVIGGADANTGQFEGLHALKGAESILGAQPRMIIAPGFTHLRPADAANPVVAEAQGICERMRAVMFADGPNTNDAAAIQWAQDFGSDRIYLSDPWHKVLQGGNIIDRPPSAALAGIQAKADNEVGFWKSLSNELINGIVGTSRPVDFVLGDKNSRANLLNEAKVGTTIRQNGYRTWGNRSLTADSKWHFLCVRRTADIINDSLLRAHLWAVDRGITRNYNESVTEGVNSYLSGLQALGAILGGKCWADPELNTAANVQLGKVYFNFDFTPVYPAEHVVFRSHLVNDYIEEVFA